MTYNHENGEIKFYVDEIERITNLSHVVYYGIEEIKKIIEGLG